MWGNELNQDYPGLPCGVDFILVQYPGLPVEGTVATSPTPPPLQAVRKSASVLEQPHPGNTSANMEHYEIKALFLAGQSLYPSTVAHQPIANLRFT